MKKTLFCILLLCFSHTLIFGQNNCEEKFTSDDALRWRKQLGFIPKYGTTEAIDNVLVKLSERAYSQIQLEIRVICRNSSEKKKNISNFYYFWDNNITEGTLNLNFPAYYLFYQLDKTFLENSNQKSKLYPSKTINKKKL